MTFLFVNKFQFKPIFNNKFKKKIFMFLNNKTTDIAISNGNDISINAFCRQERYVRIYEVSIAVSVAAV